MDQVASLYAAHPFWIWLAFGAALLAVEAALGTEWLLWPATAAGVVAVVTLLDLPLGLSGEIGVFAALTLALTLGARRFMGRPADAVDINDNAARVIGQTGTVAVAFVRGSGRVFVAGAEWPAEAGADLAKGDRVVVEAVDGSRLRVRAE